MKRRLPVVSLVVVSLLLAACSKAPAEADRKQAAADVRTANRNRLLADDGGWAAHQAVDAPPRTFPRSDAVVTLKKGFKVTIDGASRHFLLGRLYWDTKAEIAAHVFVTLVAEETAQFDRNPQQRAKLHETRKLKPARSIAQSRTKLVAALMEETCDHFEAVLRRVVYQASLEGDPAVAATAAETPAVPPAHTAALHTTSQNITDFFAQFRETAAATSSLCAPASASCSAPASASCSSAPAASCSAPASASCSSAPAEVAGKDITASLLMHRKPPASTVPEVNVRIGSQLLDHFKERCNSVKTRGFMIASETEAGKQFRVQHIVLGTFADAQNAADDRLLRVVGVIESLPSSRSRADARLPTTLCHCLQSWPLARPASLLPSHW